MTHRHAVSTSTTFALIAAAMLLLSYANTAPAPAQTGTRRSHEEQVADLEARVLYLEHLLQKLHANGDGDLFLTGANLHIQSGAGATDGPVNGKGNLIIGYDEDNGDDKSGSHNLIIGPFHSYSSFAGLIAGWDSEISDAAASVSGGAFNTASAPYSSVSGGAGNTASAISAAVSGGFVNAASGDFSSAGGGSFNGAIGDYSFVSGGQFNGASGDYASVSGGSSNFASFYFSSVGGGTSNIASGNSAWIGGGIFNNAGGEHSSISGGVFNIASGDYSTVSGGSGNEASGNWSTVSGGCKLTAEVYCQHVP